MRRESIHFDEISIRGICGDLAHSILYIILAAAALWLGATGVGNLTYTPQYTSSATVVVTARNEYSTYSSLSMANEMAGVFSEVFQSDALREIWFIGSSRAMEHPAGVLSHPQFGEIMRRLAGKMDFHS